MSRCILISRQPWWCVRKSCGGHRSQSSRWCEGSNSRLSPHGWLLPWSRSSSSWKPCGWPWRRAPGWLAFVVLVVFVSSHPHLLLVRASVSVDVACCEHWCCCDGHDHHGYDHLIHGLHNCFLSFYWLLYLCFWNQILSCFCCKDNVIPVACKRNIPISDWDYPSFAKGKSRNKKSATIPGFCTDMQKGLSGHAWFAEWLFSHFFKKSFHKMIDIPFCCAQ